MAASSWSDKADIRLRAVKFNSDPLKGSHGCQPMEHGLVWGYTRVHTRGTHGFIVRVACFMGVACPEGWQVKRPSSWTDSRLFLQHFRDYKFNFASYYRDIHLQKRFFLSFIFTSYFLWLRNERKHFFSCLMD